MADFSPYGNYVSRLHIPARLLFDGVATHDVTRARSASIGDTSKLYPSLGETRFARPSVSRRIGDARIRQAATFGADTTVSVVPNGVRARPRECAGDRCGLRMVSARAIPAVSFRIPHRIWNVCISGAFSDPRILIGGGFSHRRAPSAPLSYKTGQKSTANT